MIKPAGWDEINKRSNAVPAAEIIKARVTMPDAIRMYAPNPAPRFNRIPCPIHGGKDYNLSYQRDRYKCYVCGSGGDSIDFVRALFGLNYAEAVKKINADFNLELDFERPSEATQAAFQAALACREEQENRRREALQDFHRWRDAWITLDQWRTAYPPGDPRHDTAERDIEYASYRWDCAEARLNQLNSCSC